MGFISWADFFCKLLCGSKVPVPETLLSLLQFVSRHDHCFCMLLVLCW